MNRKTKGGGNRVKWRRRDEKSVGNWNVGGSRERENEIKMVPYADGELQSDRDKKKGGKITEEKKSTVKSCWQFSSGILRKIVNKTKKCRM